MKTGEVLVINDGLSGPCNKIEKGLLSHHSGLQDVTSGEYRVIVLQWVNGIVIENSSSHPSDKIFSTDIHRVLEIIRAKMAGLHTPSGVPIIIESATRKLSGLKTLSSIETNFLIRRILSGKTSKKSREIALVNPPNKTFYCEALRDAQDISRQYPNIKFHFGSPFDCLCDMAEGETFDAIALFHGIGNYYPEFLDKKQSVGEDAKTFLNRNTRYTLKKTSGSTSVTEGFQTTFPYAIIGEFSEGCSRHRIRRLKESVLPDINISNFLDKCPKV